ncbi:MAG: hypothetical protein CMF62_00980 [Magnetococcales bacterium]|nr:hypothetical protein [Magnetococcales bacterium]|tara:strand:+ start:4840 stop:5238 length:399 start_codon:yes stop_codon:yes gene_type:complete
MNIIKTNSIFKLLFQNYKYNNKSPFTIQKFSNNIFSNLMLGKNIYRNQYIPINYAPHQSLLDNKMLFSPKDIDNDIKYNESINNSNKLNLKKIKLVDNLNSLTIKLNIIAIFYMLLGILNISVFFKRHYKRQ